jgi:Rap1a immunity proteins
MRSEWRIRTNLVSASIFALMVCSGILPAEAKAAVTEDSFLVRTTGDLVDLCKATSADPLYTAAVNFCHGFSVGVYRVLEADNQAKTRHLFCVSDRTPRRTESIAAFVQWADAHPDQKNLGPADGIAAYLQQQFPCGRGQ